jgi:hypothetical protein
MDNVNEMKGHTFLVDVFGRHWINDLDVRKGQSS